MNTRQEEKQLALSTARALSQLILTTRLWNASHGGVYVPTTNKTQPNKYLPPSQDQTITTDKGLKLTKINPSYMTRQFAELAMTRMNGIKFHLTSLDPINPNNKATEWETGWLKSFEKGAAERSDFFVTEDMAIFRYMTSLKIEAECLKCHAQQGYKMGDIRGGLSVSIPYPTHTHIQQLIGYIAIAIIGLLTIYISAYFNQRKKLLFDATFNSPVPTCVTDKNFKILMANESYWNEFGAPKDGRKKILCFEHRPGKSCHTENCPLTMIMGGSESYTCEVKKKMGETTRHFIINAKPLLDTRNKVIGIVESFQEITKRKLAEEALAESNRKLEALSNTDGLTGIANRRLFDDVLRKEYGRHTRSEKKLSLILLDIDYFKLFNDCYGHIRGDECLQQIAKVIANCTSRPSDLAARYGGEEFACILPETDRIGAVNVAEKIRGGILALAVPHKGSKINKHVTASFGVLTIKCTMDRKPTETITQVDKLLYRAKSSGRNRVISHTMDDEG
ncbi:MAG: diguanylate cyclase [Desulfobulbaceae bacterium]|nr:diguanylate cyclase [Desulfobulbaceae bacterium]